MLWTTGPTSKPGHRHAWLVEFQLLVFAVPLIFGVLLSALLPLVLRHPWPVALGSVGAMWLGAVSVAISKVSLFRQGIWVSWGSRLMGRHSAILYRIGYGLIGLGTALLLLTWMLTA